MPKLKKEHRSTGTISVDVTSVMEKAAEFFTLSVGCPPCERSLKYEAKALGLADVPEAKAVIREGRRFTTLPQDEVQTFLDIRSRARREFLSYAVNFPFLPAGVIPVRREKIGEMFASMNVLYEEFVAAREKLLDKLQSLKEERLTEYTKAGEAVFQARAPKYNDGTAIPHDKFIESWTGVFHRWFPTAAEIQKEYFFDLRSVGSIRNTITFMTRDEYLKDEETAAKLRIMEDTEKKLRSEFYDWVAAIQTNTRIGLLRALQPVCDGLSNGHSVGAREIERIEAHVSKIKNMDLFGDTKLDSLFKMVTDATATLKEDLKGADKALAEINLKVALHKVEKSCENLAFDPTKVLKLDLDDDTAEVFADKNVMAEITERMNAQLAEAIHDLASKGGSDEDKKNAEMRLRTAVGLKKLADAGVTDEFTLGIASRSLNLDLDDELPPVTVEPMEVNQ